MIPALALALTRRVGPRAPLLLKSNAIGKTNKTEQGFMYAFAMLIDQIINLYIWTLLAYLATGWLIAFKIINPWQPVVRVIIDALSRIHEPLLRPVRRILPDFGALDVSPIVLFLLAQFLRNLLHSMLSA